MKTYNKLDIWKKSIELVKNIYELTKSYPSEENILLVNQIRKIAISIPSNIAKEGSLQHYKELKKSLYTTLVSLSELDTQLIISKELKYINEEEYNKIFALIDEIKSGIENNLDHRVQKEIKETKEFRIKKIIYWTPAIIWMLVIFYLSSQPASDSGAISMKIATLIKSIVNKLSIEITLSELHFYIRKAAHFSIYFILSILISFAFHKTKSKLIIIKTLLICLFFALFDEFNQLFTLGRVGSSKDIFIDFIGAFIGSILFKLESLRRKT